MGAGCTVFAAWYGPRTAADYAAAHAPVGLFFLDVGDAISQMW